MMDASAGQSFNIHYDFRIETMLGSSLSACVCRRTPDLFMLSVFGVYDGIQHALIIWITLRVPYKRQEVLTLFLCCPIMCLYLLSSVLWCPLRFPHKNHVRFVLSPVVLRRGISYLRYLCLYAFSGVQHILCCIFIVFLGLMHPMMPVSLDCPFFYCSFGIL